MRLSTCFDLPSARPLAMLDLIIIKPRSGMPLMLL